MITNINLHSLSFRLALFLIDTALIPSHSLGRDNEKEHVTESFRRSPTGMEYPHFSSFLTLLKPRFPSKRLEQ
jgi:hypothetical protein